MGALLTAADSDSIYGPTLPYSSYKFGVIIPFTVASLPGADQSLLFCGDKDTDASYLECTVAGTTGLAKTRDRQTGATYATTAAGARLASVGVNLFIAFFDNSNGESGAGVNDGTYKGRVRLNGGAVATRTTAIVGSLAAHDRIAFGRLMDSTPGGAFDGNIEQALWFDDYDTMIAAADAIWNSGTVLDPSTVDLGSGAGVLGQISQHPFDAETGSVTGTDTYIDDAVGVAHLDTVGGSPVYAASIFAAEDAGAQTGAFTSCTINGPRMATFLFAKPTSYNWNGGFVEASAKRPTFTVTSPTIRVAGASTDTRTVSVQEIKSAGLSGTDLQVVIYTDQPIKNGDTLTVTGAAGWYTDADADVTAAMSASAVTNSVAASYDWGKPAARWATVPHQVVNSAGYIEAMAFHTWGMDSMVFKQSTTTLRTIDMTVAGGGYETSSLDGFKVLRAPIDPSSYADGPVAFDFEAYPTWGDNARKTATDPTVGSLSLYMNSGGSLTTSEYWVDSVSGNDTTGDGSEGNPWATVGKAVTAWKSAGTGRFIIYCEEGTYTYTANLTSPTDCSTWCIITKSSTAARANVIIQPAGYNLGVQKLCYRNVTIDQNNGLNQVGETQSFTGNAEVWIDNCVVSGPGQQYAENSGYWIETVAAWDAHYITDTAIQDLSCRGMQYTDLGRNCTMNSVQNSGCLQCYCLIGVDVTDVAKYTGSAQHPDGIFWTAADTDLSGVVSQCSAVDIQGQPTFADLDIQNLAVVASLFVQRTEAQYQSLIGNDGANHDHRNILFDGCTFPNNDFSFSGNGTVYTEIKNDVVLRNCAARDIGAAEDIDDYDIRIEDCHSENGQYTGRYTLGTQTTGDPGFTNGSIANYDAGAVDYTPTASSTLINRVQSVLSNYYDIDGVQTLAGSAIGAEQAAAPTISSIDPATGAVGETGTMTFTGTGFVDGLTLLVNAGQLTMGAPSWTSSTEFTSTYTVVSMGSHTITVINPDLQQDTITFTGLFPGTSPGIGIHVGIAI